MVKKRGKDPTYFDLLNDEDVNRWYKKVCRGSKVTADVYLRRLGNYCNAHNTTPVVFVNQTKKDLEDQLNDLVTELEDDKTGSYIHSIIKALKSWLDHNGKTVGKIKIKDADGTPTLTKEQPLTLEELNTIIYNNNQPMSSRLAVVLVAQTGIRPGTLGNYDGSDGLRIGDFPEIKIRKNKKKIEFEKIPTRIRIRKEITKSNRKYDTFLGEQGCGILREYLEERMRKGEKLTDDSPIISTLWGKKEFPISAKISERIRRAFRSVDYTMRPYVLRSFFASQTMIAESKRKVIRDYRQYWMGHKGDITRRYTTQGRELTGSMIEDMRENYAQCQEFLETTSLYRESEEDRRQLVKIEVLKALGVSEDIINENNLLGVSEGEFKQVIGQAINTLKENGTAQTNGNGTMRKAISHEELDDYLEQGWDVSNELSNGRIIIKKE